MFDKDCDRESLPRQEESLLNWNRRFGDQPFDVLPIPWTSIEDLNVVAFEREYLPQVLGVEAVELDTQSIQEQLARRKFITSGDDPTPTLLGILVTGKNTRQILPGAYVQFLRIDGTELWDKIVDSEVVEGSIGDQCRKIVKQLRAHNGSAADSWPTPNKIGIEAYPLRALEELTTNAVLHRSYEGNHSPVRVTWFNDRIEIINPRYMPGELVERDFGTPGVTQPPNPNLAEAMKVLSLVKGFGNGIATARTLLSRAGHPSPEFELAENFLRVIVHARRPNEV